MSTKVLYLLLLVIFSIAGCSDKQKLSFDTVIINGLVFSGENTKPRRVDLGILGDRISYINDFNSKEYLANNVIDATGMWVTPGFIDPHSHGVEELFNGKNGAGLNNLAQGVTTVFYGNDGYGSPHIGDQFSQMEEQGIRYNVALFVGHGAVRTQVIGRGLHLPTESELEEMKTLVAKAMEEGALGLSTGLFYVPGTYAKTDEVIELSKVAAKYGGIYESHIRDESNYNIGLVAAVEEVLEISRGANIPVHIAHIKALGVDLWGKSKDVIELVERGQKEGLKISADQYPWLASGIKIHKAIVPSWALAGSEEEIQARLRDESKLPLLKQQIKENIRRRGGPDSLLIVISPNKSLEGKTLQDVATEWQKDPVEAALEILSFGVLEPWTRVASFNMNNDDVQAFMSQPWVMTSSDGTNGHPRKYASFANKYREYVVNTPLLSPQQFVHRSSGLVADTFSLTDRGYIKEGYFADIAVIDPENYRPGADFANWDVLSNGVEYVLVNGGLVIEKGKVLDLFPGRPLAKKMNLTTNKKEK